MQPGVVVVVVGPTASGKTELAIALAKQLGTEVVSADARQVYRGMAIGTAQPTEAERMAAKHHLVDFLEQVTCTAPAASRKTPFPCFRNCVQTTAPPSWLEALACTSKPRCKVWTRCRPT